MIEDFESDKITSARGVIDKFKRTAENSQKKITFENVEFIFELPKNLTSYREIQDKSKEYASMLFSKNCPASFKEFLPNDEKTAIESYLMYKIIKSPVFSQTDTLELARDCPELFLYLYSEVVLFMGSVRNETHIEAIEEAKN